MPPIIREAHPDDANQLVALVHRLSEEPDVDILLGPGEFTLTVEQERALLADYAASPNSIYLVAEIDGQIAGMLNATGGKRRANTHVATLGISIDKPWRNQGLGRALMARAIEWAAATTSITRLELMVFARNQHAIHLYQQFGFELEGRRRQAVYKDGQYLDDLLMARLFQDQ
jgi:RimJ/RimL family protein N-acetyltransferase